MLLNAEIKDQGYADLPRQQEAQYAPATTTYLKADASTGKNYVDLNAAAKTYMGAWLFGQEHVQCYVGRLKAQWQQWCPVPAGIADGVLLKGNVIYQNADKSYRMSSDQYEGVLRTEGNERVFVGKTQHTFYGSNMPNGSMKVVAEINIPLTQRLAYNPMVHMPSQQVAQQNNMNMGQGAAPYSAQQYGGGSGQQYGGGNLPYGGAPPQTNLASYGNYSRTYPGGEAQEPDSGF